MSKGDGQLLRAMRRLRDAAAFEAAEAAAWRATHAASPARWGDDCDDDGCETDDEALREEVEYLRGALEEMRAERDAALEKADRLTGLAWAAINDRALTT